MTETEEFTLLQWIFSMNKCGVLLRPTTVQDIVNILLINCDMLKFFSIVGINWVNKFVQQHNILKTWFLWKYDYKRALYENSRVIQEWFKLIQWTIEEQRIAQENIYNFDEINFNMSMIVTAKVITQTDKHSCSSLVQSGNWKWVIVIKIINAAGWILPSMIIFASKTHCIVWFENINLLLN